MDLLVLINQYPWLSFVKRPLDEILIDAVEATDFQATAATEYDFHSFDRLLDEAGRRLDQCLAYRREYSELLAVATRQALEYQLFSKQANDSRDLDIQPWLETTKALEENANRSSIPKFAAGLEPVSQGFAELSRGAEATAQGAIAGERIRKAAVMRRWNALVQYQNDLNARHTQAGSALNFEEQALRIRALLVQDFQEAWKKAYVAAQGLHELFGLELNFPDTETTHPLDDLLHWTRAALTRVDILLERADVREVIVSLREAQLVWSNGLDLVEHRQVSPDFDKFLTDPAFGKPVNQSFAFRVEEKAGLFVKRFVFPEVEESLVRGIGVSLILNDSKFPEPKLLTADVTIECSSTGQTRAVRFSDVGVADSSGSTKIYYDTPLRNVAPDKSGSAFSLILNRIGYSQNHIAASWSDVRDIRIHFLLLGFGRVPVTMPNPVIPIGQIPGMGSRIPGHNLQNRRRSLLEIFRNLWS